MGSSDTFSFPSEPPDIRNWFSSYAYQSPDLDSINDLKDCNESKGNGFGDIEKEKENRDFLLVERKKASTGFDQCVISCGDNKSTYEDFGSSDCQSLPSVSEPPDIRNWFSSYEYESPALDSSDGFVTSDHNDNNSSFKEQDVTNNTEQEEDFRDSREAVRCDLVGKDKDVTSGLVKCNCNVKANKNDNQQVCKQSHEAIRNISLNGNLKTTENDENGSIKDIVNNGIPNGAVESKSSREGSHKLLEISDSDHHDGTPLKKLITLAETFRAKHSTAHIISMVDEKSSKEATGRRDEKENCGDAFPENGFISTRKKGIRVRDENYLQKPLGDQSSCTKARVTGSLSMKKDALVGRTILSERTNFQKLNIPEITGKWQCPQKNKPSLGRPLKQLRLEQWVHRDY